MDIKNKQLRFFISDFDGVFTDNYVYLNSKGQEFVKCSRSDGYGIKILKAANKIGLVNLEIGLLSTEKNKVVNKRAQKLGISCFSGIENKYNFLEEFYFPSFGLDAKSGFSNLIYLGNDLNDLSVIKKAGISFAPKDAHELIQKSASYVLHNKAGGQGFVREVIENILGRKNLLTALNYLEKKF
jgi:YrbI family 3-deoxy-D-manno-octulosonate 8-phosphate phosphatase